jgi:UDP-glucose 4-epimerase
MGTSLVIGGAGFIGSSLVRELAAQDPVRVLDNLSTGRHANIGEIAGVDFVEGSVLDDAALATALANVSVVYHLACLGVRHSIQHPLANHAVNALGTLKVLEEARRQHRPRIVYVSTSEVYGTARRVPMTESHPTWPHTVYGGAKLAGEAYARAYHRTYGLETVVIRPFNAYGPRSHHEGDSGEVIPKFIVRAMNGLPPLVFGDGQQTRDFTYVDDTARAIAAAGTSRAAVGETINVGSGVETSILDLVTLVAKATGRTDLEPAFHPSRPGDVLRLHADSSKAGHVLGWQPEVALTDGLERLLTWHAEQGTNWAAALADDVAHNWMAPPSMRDVP